MHYAGCQDILYTSTLVLGAVGPGGSPEGDRRVPLPSGCGPFSPCHHQGPSTTALLVDLANVHMPVAHQHLGVDALDLHPLASQRPAYEPAPSSVFHHALRVQPLHFTPGWILPLRRSFLISSRTRLVQLCRSLHAQRLMGSPLVVVAPDFRQQCRPFRPLLWQAPMAQLSAQRPVEALDLALPLRGAYPSI